MKPSTKNVYLISMILTGIATFASSVLHTLLLRFSYDASIGHFTSDSVLFRALCVLLICMALLALVPFFVLRGCRSLRVLYSDIPTLFSCGFSASVTALYALLSLLQFPFFTAGMPVLAVVISLFALLCALLSCAFPLLLLFGPGGREHYALLAVLPVILTCALTAFSLYFDTELFMNSPVKIFHQISLLLLAFFFLLEGRLLQGRIRFGTYTAVGLFTFLFALSDAVATLTDCMIRKEADNKSCILCFWIFALALYTGARVLSVYRANTVPDDALLRSFTEIAAEDRQEEATAEDAPVTEEPIQEQFFIPLETPEEKDMEQ